jgi:hypothetical protein
MELGQHGEIRMFWHSLGPVKRLDKTLHAVSAKMRQSNNVGQAKYTQEALTSASCGVAPWLELQATSPAHPGQG